MHPMTQERELTTQEVAERLRISWLSVIRRIQAGKIRARKEGNEWRIRESDLEDYINSTYPDDKK
jgi:excisionase family DNA binding protein